MTNFQTILLLIGICTIVGGCFYSYLKIKRSEAALAVDKTVKAVQAVKEAEQQVNAAVDDYAARKKVQDELYSNYIINHTPKPK